MSTIHPAQAVGLIGLALVILAIRGGGNDEEIKKLRTEIERRSEMIRSYPATSEAHRLYAEETDAMAAEIRRLKAGTGIPKVLIISAIVFVTVIGIAATTA